MISNGANLLEELNRNLEAHYGQSICETNSLSGDIVDERLVWALVTHKRRGVVLRNRFCVTIHEERWFLGVIVRRGTRPLPEGADVLRLECPLIGSGWTRKSDGADSRRGTLDLARADNLQTEYSVF